MSYERVSYIDRARQFRCQREVGVIEGNVELALFVKWVLEVYTCWLGAWWTFNGTLI